MKYVGFDSDIPADTHSHTGRRLTTKFVPPVQGIRSFPTHGVIVNAHPVKTLEIMANTETRRHPGSLTGLSCGMTANPQMCHIGATARMLNLGLPVPQNQADQVSAMLGWCDPLASAHIRQELLQSERDLRTPPADDK